MKHQQPQNERRLPEDKHRHYPFLNSNILYRHLHHDRHRIVTISNNSLRSIHSLKNSNTLASFH